jgi:filamentous hemagglutinin
MWAGAAPLLRYSGAMDLTQSSVVTERGGDISLVNPGGAVTVGLKDNSTNGGNAAAKGVITLGGGNVFGYARNDFQVNTQRVFIVGQGDMSIWSSVGDIDSGRGANTAVAAPPLAARRSIDGVVFETPATTTGSGLGILEDSSGRRSGTIGLFPAFGEILALDAFIRAPSVVLGSSIKGADNLLAASVGGAAAPVAAPALAVAPPASQEARAADSAANAASQNQDAKPRNALLTVDLLGLGPATDDECAEKDKVDSKCPPPPARKCSDPDKAKGLCK